jgi:hypothetical protein
MGFVVGELSSSLAGWELGGGKRASDHAVGGREENEKNGDETLIRIRTVRPVIRT